MFELKRENKRFHQFSIWKQKLYRNIQIVLMQWMQDCQLKPIYFNYSIMKGGSKGSASTENLQQKYLQKPSETIKQLFL